MKRVLFLCSRSQWRSPAAEKVFAAWPGLEVMSAGFDPLAVEPVTPEHLEWAEVIFRDGAKTSGEAFEEIRIVPETSEDGGVGDCGQASVHGCGVGGIVGGASAAAFVDGGEEHGMSPPIDRPRSE